ncbi:putative cell wall glucanase (Utr2) [Aspergillus clavatus NRRL 1]|uniref:Crh-like protein n=1 Tax=Aspergillus clavatus (strain ATCC 1007 / CBS 513.65 / DSM 816 / NCTC 3887 / NRRL 1 / QM 1276 / 107) TaxID=344612 RepID=A1CF25_ASPCL|nr:cell wall glucanase (Utr2), putative [Aspergillus clavatus NRRL 1]EAW11474.1 cell wall glucanase (Utr2), putative [Aspergillus clavatus NRRL 1]
MVRITSSLYLATLAATTAFAASDPPSCSQDNHCPEEWPCCSLYGQCGTGAYCLGGCDPLMSHSLDSCVPEPTCQSKTYKGWSNLDGFAENTKYLGDASKSDWVYSGYPKIEDGNLLLTMPKESVGTLIANNHYLWYGKITAKVKSSRGAGVVTGFILMSDTKDEIDYEFVGADLTNVQTNFYFQGVLDYNNGANASVPGGDTFGEWHEYSIDWKPDALTWSVDGEVKRTLTRESTFNKTSNRYQYPQTPSRMQLSLWPAGQASNAPGTISWAGGQINWDSEDIKKDGYFSASFAEITVECYDPPKGADIKGSKSYIFTNNDGLESSVRITDNKTVLASFGATGLNMDLGASTSASGGANKTSSGANTIPSGNGGSANVPGNSQGGNSSSSSTGSSSGSASSGSSDSSSSGGFSQGTGSSGASNKNAAPSQSERVMKGSFFAVLVAVVVLVTL